MPLNRKTCKLSSFIQLFSNKRRTIEKKKEKNLQIKCSRHRLSVLASISAGLQFIASSPNLRKVTLSLCHNEPRYITWNQNEKKYKQTKKGLYFFEIFHHMSINCSKYHIDWKSLDVWYIICTLHICTLHIYNLWHEDSVRLMRDCSVAAKLSDWDWQS